MMSSAGTKPTIDASEESDHILSAMEALQEEFVRRTNESMQQYQRQLDELLHNRLAQLQVVDDPISKPTDLSLRGEDSALPSKEERSGNSINHLGSARDSQQHCKKQSTREYISKAKKALRASQAHLSIFQILVRSQQFETGVAILIFVSVLFLGFKAEVRQETLWFFPALEISFCVLFSLELCARLTADWHRFWSNDAMWNIFDVCTVVASILDICLTYMSPTSNPPNLMVLRCIRCLRVLRLARVLKQPMFRELRLMIYSILCCAKPFMWAVFLLCLVIYVFAIIFTHAARDAQQAVTIDAQDKDKLLQTFGLLTRSMYSLLASILGGADWADYGQIIGQVHALYKSAFVFYVIFAQLALLNVVTGIFLDSSLRAATSDKQMMIQEEMMREGLNKAEFEKLFYEASDDEEHLAVDQLTEYLSDTRVKTYLRLLDVIYENAQDLVKMFTKTETGSVSADEFVKGCITYKSMQVTDLNAHLRENRRLLEEVHSASASQVALREGVKSASHQARPADNKYVVEDCLEMVCSMEQKLKHALQASNDHGRNNDQDKRGGRSFENAASQQESGKGLRNCLDMGDDDPEESQMGVTSSRAQEDDAVGVWQVRKLEIKTKRATLP